MKKINAQKESILTKNQLEKDYKQYKSIAKIATKYSVSYTVIRSRLIKYNIPIQGKKYNSNYNIFSEETEQAFYLAGFIAADGCIRVSKTNKNSSYINHRLVIALAEKDIDFLYKIRGILECENPVGIYEVKLNDKNKKWNNTKVAKFSITSEKMIQDLKKFNIGPQKSLTYDMSEWLITHKLIHHFIRGYIDGDGSFYISSKRKNVSFSLRGTVPFLEKIKNIFNMLCNLCTKSNINTENGIGKLSINSNIMVVKIFNYIYKDATIFMKRKHDIAQKANELIEAQQTKNNKIQEILSRKV